MRYKAYLKGGDKMTKLIMICDHCQKEVDSLMKWPKFYLERNCVCVKDLKENYAYAEYCKECTTELIMYVNGYKKEIEDEA